MRGLGDRKGHPIGINLRKAHPDRPFAALRVTRRGRPRPLEPGPVSSVDAYWLTARVNPTIHGGPRPRSTARDRLYYTRRIDLMLAGLAQRLSQGLLVLPGSHRGWAGHR